MKIFTFLFLMILLPFSSWAGEPSIPLNWSACQTHAECTPIGTGCCESGYNQAINMKHAPEWQAKHPKESCAGMGCIAVVIFGACVQGQCVVSDTNPLEPDKYCQADHDCVPVGDCCNYTDAVNKNFKPEWERLNPFPERCALVECDRPEGVAKCTKGICHLDNNVTPIK